MVTTSRSDYGIFLPVLRRIQEDPALRLVLLVSGSHLSPELGMTGQMIEDDGFEISQRIDMLLSSDTPEGIAKSMGLGTIGFAQAYSSAPPDILLVLGDRFEMLAAVTAALPFNIPVAHIHGGESTEGLIDEAIRHSITKMSHLHFVTTECYAQRVIQMGEQPWRVTVSGAPSLDNLTGMQLLTRGELQDQHGLNTQSPYLLVTYHPVTLERHKNPDQVKQLLNALHEAGLAVIFTYPNADTHRSVIIDQIQEYVVGHSNSQAAVNLGSQGYFSAMSHAEAMVGNSSSGIIEAASFQLPVVNIGIRQLGRIHGANVIPVGDNYEDILAGIKQAVSSQFRSSLKGLVNLYGDGNASEKIVNALKATVIEDGLLIKKFHDAAPIAS